MNEKITKENPKNWIFVKLQIKLLIICYDWPKNEREGPPKTIWGIKKRHNYLCRELKKITGYYIQFISIN